MTVLTQSVIEAVHKNTRWHGFTCEYPLNLDHGNLIDKYVAQNKSTLTRTSGVMFYNSNHNKYSSSAWSPFVRSVFEKHLPSDIPCPNPKDFRKMFITYMGNEVRMMNQAKIKKSEKALALSKNIPWKHTNKLMTLSEKKVHDSCAELDLQSI